MEKIRSIQTKENSQPSVSLGYPALIALTTVLTEACKLSSNDAQNLIPRGAAVVSLLGAIFVISGAYIFIRGRNRK